MARKFTGRKSEREENTIIIREERKGWIVTRWLGRFFMLLGFMAFMSSMISLIVVAQLLTGKSDDKKPENGVVLIHHFKGGLTEVAATPTLTNPSAAFGTTLHDVTKALRLAAEDEEVKAFIGRISDGPFGMAEVQELIFALEDFKKSGKKAYAYGTAFGDFSNGMAEYYLASAFDEIWMQPTGNITLSGFAAEVPYFKSALGKVGIETQIFQRKEFKSAPESTLRDDMSPAARMALQALLDGYERQFAAQVKTSRNLDISPLIGGSPIISDRAVELGLIDHLDYADSLTSMIAERYNIPVKDYRGLTKYKFAKGEEGEDSSLLDEIQEVTGDDEAQGGLETDADGKEKKKNQIALIYISGAIMPNAQAADPFGSGIASAAQIAVAIKKAADTETVQAIVLRVASPGGSPSASETIRRAVVYAKNKGKKIVVSMGNAAASGGYWVVVDADKIYALPGTATGSIGVFGGKVVLEDLWSKLGVNWETVTASSGAASTLWSQNKRYNEQNEAYINTLLDETYYDFTKRVSEGRKMPIEDVERIARGRVWIGEDALKVGLVDEMGDLEAAINGASEMIGLPREEVDIRILPERDTTLKLIMKLLGPQASASIQGVTASDVPAFHMLDGTIPFELRDFARYQWLQTMHPSATVAMMPPYMLSR